MPLIGAEDALTLSAILMVVVALGMYAEKLRWGQQIGGPLILIGAGMLLSNVGVIPYSAPVYGQVAGFLVPAAIPLLLLRADFRTIVSESGPMLVAFTVAVVATVAGAVVGVMVVDMGVLEPQIAGTVTASYIGGSLNFVATAEAVGIGDSAIYVAGLSADAVGAVFFLLVLMIMPSLRIVRAAMPSKFIGAAAPAGDPESVAVAAPVAEPFHLARASNGIALSLVICAVSAGLTRLLAVDSLYILIVTALSLLVANFGKPLTSNVGSEFEIGTLFMYLFFVCIGAGANIADVLGAALPILAFIVVMVLVHLVVVTIIGKFMRLDLAEVMIASNACILGPAPAAALAASKGWQPLVAPGILVGVLGYAIATFIGVAMTTLWQAMG